MLSDDGNKRIRDAVENAKYFNKIINEKRESSDKQHISIIVDEFHLYIDENNNEVIKKLLHKYRK